MPDFPPSAPRREDGESESGPARETAAARGDDAGSDTAS